MKRITVSVILPVYNTAAYLERCVDSLLSQTYAPHEVILVDDGSTDGSGALCDRLAAAYSCIRVRHIPNGGVSVARNTGMDMATGDFIAFADSDDVAGPMLLEHLVAAQALNDADYTFGGFAVVQDKGGVQMAGKEKIPPAGIYTIEAFVARIDRYAAYLYTPWKSLYKTSLLRQQEVRFPVGVHIGEDAIFVANYLLYCDTVAVTATADYSYMLYEGESLSSTRELTPPRYNLEAARLKTALKTRCGIDCGRREYAILLYDTMVFNFIRVFGKRTAFSEKQKYTYCAHMVRDPDTRRYAAQYRAYNIQTALLRLLIRLKLVPLLYLLWKVRCIGV